MSDTTAHPDRCNVEPAAPLPTFCEEHDVAGECTQECADLIAAMSGDGGGETMVYGDYLGGTSSIDVSGCHAGPPTIEYAYEYDAANKRVVRRVIDPEDDHLMDCAIRANAALGPGDWLGCGPEVKVASLIADLLHYAEAAGYGAASTLDLARYHYTDLDGGTL